MPVLMVSAGGLDRLLAAGASYRLGRDPSADIVFDDARVSWQHAVLRLDQGEWVLEDTGSKNGIFTGPRRVSLMRITGDCMMRLADSQDGPEVWCRFGRPGLEGDVKPLAFDFHRDGLDRSFVGTLRAAGFQRDHPVVQRAGHRGTVNDAL